MTAPARPLLRWHGGKWLLAPWIISLLPPHRAYVEPYGGAGSVLLRKPPSFAELWNDLDGEVVNLFRVLRDRSAAPELLRLIGLTPFAREEFELAFEAAEEPIERARRLIMRAYMGQGSVSNDRQAGATGFRNSLTRSNAAPWSPTPAHDWAGFPVALRAAIDRLAPVTIESRDALELIAQQDRHDCLFYLDPPYLPETRSRKSRRRGEGFVAYQHEMTADQHRQMLDLIVGLEGMVVLSGYPSDLYDAALPGWRRVTRQAQADSRDVRTEVLWLNPAAVAATDGGPLFAVTLA